MPQMRLARLAALSLAAVLVALPVAAETAARNILIILRVAEPGDATGAEATTYRLIVPSGRGTVEMFDGQRVPIPVTRFNAETASNGAIAPVTSYTYQNVGVTTKLRATISGDGKVEIDADLEHSVLGSASPAGQPTIDARRRRIYATLVPQQPLRVLEIARDGDEGYYEIQAELLD